jgi:acetyl esterase
MPLDPAVQNLLDGLTAQGVPAFAQMSVAQAREVVATFTALQAPPREVARVIDTTYPGPSGDQDIRLYIPDAPAPLPVVVYFHAGGWVTDELNRHMVVYRRLKRALPLSPCPQYAKVFELPRRTPRK